MGHAAGCGLKFWDGETKEIGTALTLIRCGGHFEGGTVLHWPEERTARAQSSAAIFSKSFKTAVG